MLRTCLSTSRRCTTLVQPIMPQRTSEEPPTLIHRSTWKRDILGSLRLRSSNLAFKSGRHGGTRPGRERSAVACFPSERHTSRGGSIVGHRRGSMRQEITIAANDSGRLWTDDVERWNALCRPEGCVVCRDDELPSGMYVLAETPMVEAMSMESVPLPGYVCVTSNKHAVEPFDLSVEDQRWFWTDAMLIARGVADAVRPAKM